MNEWAYKWNTIGTPGTGAFGEVRKGILEVLSGKGLDWRLRGSL